MLLLFVAPLLGGCIGELEKGSPGSVGDFTNDTDGQSVASNGDTADAVDVTAGAVDVPAVTGADGAPVGTAPAPVGGAGNDPTPVVPDQQLAAGGQSQQPDLEPVLDTGRTVLRRLNRVEYDNTVRDLTGTSLRPGQSLPDDESAFGFDTIGEALVFTQLHLEQLEAGASAVIDELFALPVDAAQRTAVLSCALQPGTEATCGREILTAFATRAFRRPVEPAAVDRLLGLADSIVAAGFSYEEGLKASLRAVLMSPRFIYRLEGQQPGVPELFALDNYELATRLSYFLWSSMPDQALYEAAASAAPLDVAGEATRMLADPKAAGFFDNFVGQWLTLRDLPQFEADLAVFPTFDVAVRDDAVEETRQFVRVLLEENLPLESLLLADFSMMNERLAAHYGVAGGEANFARTSLSGVPRMGLLTQASFLMRSSLPARTSPVKRGAWVLDQLLCSPPPPVPAGLIVDDLVSPEATSGMTLRQALEAHRSSPACAACHNLMDPIGLGLENYDAIGGYRTSENGAVIDASGSIGDVAFSGALELAPILADDPRFAECTAERLLSYSTGRVFNSAEAKSYVAALASESKALGLGQWRDWLLAIVESEAFQTGRGEAPSAPATESSQP